MRSRTVKIPTIGSPPATVYAQEQLRHQQQAIAKGDPVTLSPTRRARLTADQQFKAYLEDIGACDLDFHPGAWMYASDLYISPVWPAPVPINYRRFVKLFCETFPEVRALEKDCNGVRRIIFTGVDRQRTSSTAIASRIRPAGSQEVLQK